MADQFLHGNIRFRRRYFPERQALTRLAKEGQRPVALFIGCADSRVVPEILTSAKPGELFVVRNIANHVPVRDNQDASVGAAIEYAVGSLDVSHIVVCGHTGCGGVSAALAGLDRLPPEMTELRTWLTSVDQAITPARERGMEGEAQLRCAVEENVLCSLANLLTFPTVRERLDDGRMQLHGWIYDMMRLSLFVYDADYDTFTEHTPEKT